MGARESSAASVSREHGGLGREQWACPPGGWAGPGCPFGHRAASGPQEGGGVQAPAFPEDIWRRGPSRVGKTGRVWWMWGPLCRSKPRALCPPGCYPRCPKESPIYDEDLKKCVTRDRCGCYVTDTHYSPGESVPKKHICHSWYLSSRRRGPGGDQCTCTHAPTSTHTHWHTVLFMYTHVDTWPHAHRNQGEGRSGPSFLLLPLPRPLSAHSGNPGGGSWTQPLG